MSVRRYAVPAVGLLVAVALVAGLVWFLRGDPDEQRNTSGFTAPPVTQGSFCAGVAGFRADLAAADPGGASSAYVTQVRTAADRLRAAGTPSDIPADAQAGLTAYLHALRALPDSATPRDVARLRGGGTQTERRQRKALDDYLATECPAAG